MAHVSIMRSLGQISLRDAPTYFGLPRAIGMGACGKENAMQGSEVKIRPSEGVLPHPPIPPYVDSRNMSTPQQKKNSKKTQNTGNTSNTAEIKWRPVQR